MTMRRFFATWWPTLTVVCVILYATLNDNPIGADELPIFPGADKLIHAIMFGGLFAAITFDRYRDGRGMALKSLLITAGICVVCGALDEVCQSLLTAAREGDPLDFLADCGGIVIAFFAAPPAIRVVLKNKGQH